MLALCMCFGVPAIVGLLLAFVVVPLLHSGLRSASPPAKQLSAPTSVLRIPRTAHEAHEVLSDSQFELFSAAVVIGLGQGYTFVMHVGGSGDGGVDTILQNAFLKRVYVQSKKYVNDGTNNVDPHDARDFVGTLSMSKAVYGYLVTTSLLTPQARREADAGKVRIIDAPQLDYLLQHRHHDIALAYQDVLNAVQQHN